MASSNGYSDQHSVSCLVDYVLLCSSIAVINPKKTTKTTTTTTTTTNKQKKKKECTGGKAELVFVLDSSTSVGAKNWKKELKFLEDIVSALSIGPDATRVGLVTYNTAAKLQFGLGAHTTKSSLLAAIKHVTFSEGVTATGDALALARTSVLNKARAGVKKIVILITDGRTNLGADPIKEAAKLKAMGVSILSVGITSQVNK